MIISSVVRMTIGIISTASATLPASPEKCFWVATIQVQAKTPTTIDGVPFSTSATKRLTDGNLAPRVLGAVDPGADAERQAHQAASANDDQGADDGVGHAAAGLAGGRRHPGEEIEA